MVWLTKSDHFDPDATGCAVVGIAAENLSDHDSGMHEHRLAQLLFAQKGCAAITLDSKLCLLPPTRAAWIPGGLPHRVQVRSAMAYRSVYFEPEILQDAPEKAEVFEVSAILRAVLERISSAPLETDWTQGAANNLLAVCLDEVRSAPRLPVLLPLPSDPRLARLTTTALPPPLGLLAARVGASEKTIGRVFQRETGMSYRQWRQQWRLMKAYEMLAAGTGISMTAQDLGFASDSAFITFFKGLSGQTPKAFLNTSSGITDEKMRSRGEECEKGWQQGHELKRNETLEMSG